MSRSEDAADWGTVVSLILGVKKWEQHELAREAGIDPRMISRYELGKESPSPETMRKLMRAAVLPVDWLPALFDIARTLRRFAESGGTAPSAADLASGLDRLVAASAQIASASAGLDLAAVLDRSAPMSEEEERRLAAEFWKELEAASPHERRLLVEATWDYQGRALVLEACAASERAAASDPSAALELAELALAIARRTPAGEERASLEGRAYAFQGNARRVAGQLPIADESFSRSRRLRSQCANALPCEEAYLLDLEASLRRDQRRFSEALSLHEGALAVAPAHQRAAILLNKSKLHIELQEYETALETLQEAETAISPETPPRIVFGITFNTAGSLCQLNRHAEAGRLLPGIRALAVALGNVLDLVRLRWLEGMAASGLGRNEEARTALEEARKAFAEHEIEYDRAQVSLELTVLYLEAGESTRARDLAREALEIFERQEVPREMLAALTVFYQATEQQRATAELARRLLAYLERARREPELKFEG